MPKMRVQLVASKPFIANHRRNRNVLGSQFNVKYSLRYLVVKFQQVVHSI
jgi:hypothetical protein